jgi:hypothetical protein
MVKAGDGAERVRIGRLSTRCGIVVVVVCALLTSTCAAATLTGAVTVDGQAVAGAFVAATGTSGHAATTTDSSGTYSLSVPIGTYQLAADAPGDTPTIVGGVNALLSPNTDLRLTPSVAPLQPLPVYGGGDTVAADGTPGVFYLAGENVGDVYRTTDWGGTWTQVTVAAVDPISGLSGTGYPMQLVTSGYPGEVAVGIAGAGVFYSTDYGVTWAEVGNSPIAAGLAPQLYWGHAGSRSVLLEQIPVGGSVYDDYVAGMSAVAPAFTAMTRPYPPVGAVADGANQPWLASENSAGVISLYPLVVSATAPAVFESVAGFPTDANAVGLGGESGPGQPPSAIEASGIYDAAMTVKAPDAMAYPAPAKLATAPPCTPSDQFLPLIPPEAPVAANSGGAYGAAWADSCWLQYTSGTLSYRGGYGDNAAIDAGYDETATGAGSDGVVMLAPPPAGLSSARQDITKATASDAGFPVLPTDATATATPGLSATSAGAAILGVTASTVYATAYGPSGVSEIAAATDAGGAASADGGATFKLASDAITDAVAWWRGASGSWLLFGQAGTYRESDLATAFENWTPSTPTAAAGNVGGSTATDLGVATAPSTPGIQAVAGVPGADEAFLDADIGGDTSGTNALPEGRIDRVTLSAGPAFSDLTQIGSGIITKPGPIAYCPTSGSAPSIADVLLAIGSDPSGGALYRVTSPTSAAPVVAEVASLPGTGSGAGLASLSVDCASGTVLVASGAPGAGLLTSSDGGQSFGALAVDDPGGIPATIRAVAVTPGDPAVILVGDSAGFIQRSTDGGLTWTVVNDPQTGSNLSAAANASGGIEEIVAPPDTPPATQNGDLAREVTADRDNLVVGPGEFSGALTQPARVPTNPGPATTVSGFRMSHRRFAARGARAASARLRKAPRIAVGSAFDYRLSRAATVAIVVVHLTHGRRVGAGCEPVSRRDRSAKHCTLNEIVVLHTSGRLVHGRCATTSHSNRRAEHCTLSVEAVLVHRSHAGATTVAFSGDFGGVPLPPGAYTALLIARSGTGPASASKSTKFTVVPR